MEKIAGARARRKDGFTLLDILVAACVLGLVVAGFSAYVTSTRKTMNQANQLADATRAAASALEVLKGQLEDSASFKSVYDGAESQPSMQSLERDINNRKYVVTVTVSRAPAPLYALKARARAVWGENHGIEVGVLIPGHSDFL